MKKIFVVIGTRPEAIKLAPVIWKLKGSEKLKARVCITSQHMEMLKETLDVFNIEYNYDLNIMVEKQSIGYVLREVIHRLEPIFEFDRPDMVIVQGDTISAFGAALAAYYDKIPIAHVEAGLRTYDKYNPFPEEMNRVMIDELADLLFAPTTAAWQNCWCSDEPDSQSIRVCMVGNTVIDAVRWATRQNADIEAVPMDWIRATQQRIVLITAHRRESFGKPLVEICNAVSDLAEHLPNYAFVWPVHLNPEVRETVLQRLSNRTNIMLTAPLKYLEFVSLMKESYLILTDSGGIQEEAAALDIPVLVMRQTTERQEAVWAGTASLIGVNYEAIYNECFGLLTDPSTYSEMQKAKNPFGDGHSAERIVRYVENYFR